MAFTLDISFVHYVVDLFLHYGSFFLGEQAFLRQLILILFDHWNHFVDLLVHQRLSETGLVKLVMTHLTVSDDVDDYVFVVLLAVLRRSFENVYHVLVGVGVYVENRSIDCLGKV